MQRLDVVDAVTGVALTSHTIRDFAEGRMVSVVARGNILLRMTALPSVLGTTGAPGTQVACGFSALFFDPAPAVGSTANVGAFVPVEDLHVQGAAPVGSGYLSRLVGMFPEGATVYAAMGSVVTGG